MNTMQLDTYVRSNLDLRPALDKIERALDQLSRKAEMPEINKTIVALVRTAAVVKHRTDQTHVQEIVENMNKSASLIESAGFDIERLISHTPIGLSDIDLKWKELLEGRMKFLDMIGTIEGPISCYNL